MTNRKFLIITIAATLLMAYLIYLTRAWPLLISAGLLWYYYWDRTHRKEEPMSDKAWSDPTLLNKIICSRNKLIEDLLTLPSLSEEDFKRGMKLRDEMWEKDKDMIKEVTMT